VVLVHADLLGRWIGEAEARFVFTNEEEWVAKAQVDDAHNISTRAAARQKILMMPLTAGSIVSFCKVLFL